MKVHEHSTADIQADNTIQPLQHIIQVSPDMPSNLLYLLLSFPLGILYFVVLVTGITLGLSLVIVWIGIPILLLMLALIGSMISLERRLAERLLNVIQPAPQFTPPDQGRVERLQTVVRKQEFWNSLAFLLLKMPLGILSFTLVIGLASATLALILMPLAYFLSTIFQFTLMGGFWEINSWMRAFLCMFLGLGLGWISAQVLAGLVKFWRQMVRYMLHPLY